MKKATSELVSATITDSLTDALNSSAIIEMADFMGIYYNIIDTDGRYIYKNEKFMDDFPELHENCIFAKEAWEDCKNVMQSGKRTVLEEEYRGKHFLSVKKPVYDKGKCVGIAVISHEITARKQAEIAKINLLENMAHDFNTPFNGIIGLSQILSMTEKNPERKKKLNMIAESGEAVLSLMRKILDVVKIDDPNEFQESIFNVREATKNVVLMDKTAADLKDIDIKVNCDDKIIKASKLCFEKILLNIVSNSIKFTEKGRINVDVKVKEEKLKISVSDTGIGIAKKDQSIIFEKFHRVKNSNTESKFNGSGLGLHLVKSLVEKMKGEIYLKSALGKGSTFEIILPIQEGE